MVADKRGPVLSGWLLGSQLDVARVNAGYKTTVQAARELGIDRATLKRWKTAEVVPDLMKLRALCEFYGLSAAERGKLEELRRGAKEQPWWRETGEWPDVTAELLGMEMAATRICSWDMPHIPGLLQTPEYTRLLIQALEPEIPPSQLDADVELRTGRQVQVFEGHLREAIFMVDELALTRMPGTAPTRRAQMSRLLAPPKGVTIRVVPFSAGPHPALGSFVIFDLADEQIGKGVYVDGSVTAKGLVVTGEEAEVYEKVWGWLQNKALSPQHTTRFLKKKMEILAKNED